MEIIFIVLTIAIKLQTENVIVPVNAVLSSREKLLSGSAKNFPILLKSSNLISQSNARRNSVMFKNFSEIDILCGKVDTFDMNGNFDKDTEDCD